MAEPRTNSASGVRLTELAALAGCTAKTGAESLARILLGLGTQRNGSGPGPEGLIVGLAEPDDAAVFAPPEGLALVLTVDFFAPIVDDPYAYGAIAAANAMSDVYAMGGEVQLALNVSAMPADLGEDVVMAIFRGGQEKVEEAGGSIAGGHTIIDSEPKYGLCVIGTVAPEAVMRKAGAEPGDLLYLTKPVGSGVITTAGKFEEADPRHLESCIDVMSALNGPAARALVEAEAHAMTDVTGFGLLGHSHEMAEAGGMQFRIEAAAVPVLDGALDYAYRGVLNGGMFRNRAHLDGRVDMGSGICDEVEHLLYDPQTSGGLLAAVPRANREQLEQAFGRAGLPLWCIGEVREGRGVVVASR